ncbi:MAG: hypothetical protein H6Q90_4037 [Deltaproteobacteria bacterium]|nr:hypothetical protein [Deltaproteobacteria bacterium]
MIGGNPAGVPVGGRSPGVIERVRAAALRLVHSPGWQLVVGGAVLALAFPSRLPGAIGMAILAGGLGIVAMLGWPRLPAWLRSPPDRLAGLVVVLFVLAFGLSTFWDTLTYSPDWQMGDWGPQHAVLARIMPSLPGLDTPVWNHVVSTGDAPLELYPKLAYLITGHFALVCGLSGDLPLAMMIVAVLVHLGIAVTTTMIAMRIAPKPIAFVVGALTVVDGGAVAHGGTVGLFRWGLLHSAMSLAFGTIAALGVLGALRKPRLRASIAIWLGTALACATHPAGLIAAVACMIALAAVALLASDAPPRRALIAIGHIALGIALGAVVWMPLAARIVEYGQHFPNALRTPAKLLEDLLVYPSPVTSYAMLSYAGYFGILAGLWSRRAALVFVSTVALVLLVGLCDAPYLALDLAPGEAVARLGTERLAQLARPFVAAAGAYGIAIFLGHAVRGWAGASQRQRLVAAAVLGILTASVVRVLPAFLRSATGRAYGETQVLAPDPIGRGQLTTWAAARAAELRPDAWGRALFEQDTHEHFHLTAETGLPTLHIGPEPDLLLRERIEDLTPESFRRFNIRWVVGVDRSPSMGDADSELTIGTFHIRTVKEWDGKFARIEQGTGEVRVTRLDDEAVEIEVTAAEPVLVALGTGYYPRWRARHETGAAEPVYAQRATPTSTLSVVSAWVAPGKTVFTVDGPLPSDGNGRGIALLAAVLALAGIVTWRVTRWRLWVLRRLARARGRLPKLVRVAAVYGVPLVLVVLVARGCRDAGRPVDALALGTGLRGNARVEARADDGAWQTCGYSSWQGAYLCDGLLVAFDGMTTLLNDATPSWAFNTPGLLASADRTGVEMRVRFHEQLAGTYWTATSGDSVTLDVSGEATRVIDRAIIDYADLGERFLELRARVPTTWWSFTFVREPTLVPERAFLAKPPAGPPAEVSAIRR